MTTSNSWARVAVAAMAMTMACGGEPSTGSDTFHHDEDCQIPAIDLDAPRPVSLLRDDWLAYLASRMPCVSDPALRAVLESADTVFYDRWGIVPGYQDSFGDGVELPIGMRPNSIGKVHIDLAVPGGHAQIFQTTGVFHFPFGRPIGSHEKQAAVIDFWHIPRGADDALMPVAYWKRSPSRWTNRIDWAFPVGTIFGELMFVVADGHWHPFEIRTRTRARERWESDVLRPFPNAERFARKLEERREERDDWASSAEIDALIEHARRPDTLRAATLASSRFPSAFAAVSGAEDPLPRLSDPSILKALLADTGFRSAKGEVWKSNGNLRAYAPTIDAGFSIVPERFNGGLVEVSNASCDRCHRDAGRPFKDYYANIIAYGELWGQDENFTWHPFDSGMFVGASGDVKNFNNDNRRMRGDFVQAGLVAPFNPGVHTSEHYSRIPRDWHNYVY